MIKAIEALIYQHFCTLPFHNLTLLYGNTLQPTIPGGTCSDKTLAFLADVKKLGVAAYLHSAFIGGQEIHRLVRIHLNNRIYFADVGNGWPSLKLLPADHPISFSCFGMHYRTMVQGNRLTLFHTKQGYESLQLEICTSPRPEQEILEQIATRFSSGIAYPFANSLRFSLIKGDTFLFLRGNWLEKYAESRFSKQEIAEQSIQETIKNEFGYTFGI